MTKEDLLNHYILDFEYIHDYIDQFTETELDFLDSLGCNLPNDYEDLSTFMCKELFFNIISIIIEYFYPEDGCKIYEICEGEIIDTYFSVNAVSYYKPNTYILRLSNTVEYINELIVNNSELSDIKELNDIHEFKFVNETLAAVLNKEDEFKWLIE
jgi:hypothetical protein